MAWAAILMLRLRHRASLVQLCTQLQNRIHAVAAGFGYDRTGSYWTGPGRGWLAELDLDRQSDCRYRARTAVRLAAGGSKPWLV